MDPKYAFRYKVNTSDTARANSLTDRGTLRAILVYSFAWKGYCILMCILKVF